MNFSQLFCYAYLFWMLKMSNDCHKIDSFDAPFDNNFSCRLCNDILMYYVANLIGVICERQINWLNKTSTSTIPQIRYAPIDILFLCIISTRQLLYNLKMYLKMIFLLFISLHFDSVATKSNWIKRRIYDLCLCLWVCMRTTKWSKKNVKNIFLFFHLK